MASKDDTNIGDLRAHLFASIRRLRDATPDQLQDELARAKGMADLSQVVINSAKVEVDYARVTGWAGSGFIGAGQQGVIEQRAGVTVRRHRLEG